MPTNTEINGSLSEGEQTRWEFSVPPSGLSYTLKVSVGRVVMFASLITTAPNEAFHQWKIEVSSSSKVINIIPSNYLTTSRYPTGATVLPVYTTLAGLQVRNTFTLATSGELLYRVKLPKLNCFLCYCHAEELNAAAALDVPLVMVINAVIIVLLLQILC